MKLFLRNNIWWVSHGTGGKRIRQSTGKTDREEAEQVAKEICAPAMLRDEANIVKVAAEIAAGKRQEADRLEIGRMTLDECLAAYPYRSRRGGEPSWNTVETDRLVWCKMADFMRSRNIVSPCDVTPALAVQFTQTLSRGYQKHVYTYCRRRFAVMGVSPNPFADAPKSVYDNGVHHEPLTKDEVAKVTAYLDSPGYHAKCHDATEFSAFFRFLLYTGLRLGDAATAKVSQCDFEQKVIRRVMAKTKKPVEFPMHHSLLDILPRDGEYLFPHMAELYMRSYNHLSDRFFRLFRRLGLRRGNGVVCTHSLRSTFATICCEEGVPLEVIQSWLGHASPAITRIYAHFNDMEKKRAAIEKFPEF